MEHHSGDGLTSKEVGMAYNKYGPNKIEMGKKISPIKIFLEQFSDFMVLILLGSTAISLFMGDILEGVTIISIVVVNAILGFVQEYRTEKTIEKLNNLASPNSTVIREGKIVVIKAEDVVVGDTILLEAGDRVPADGYVVEENNLLVDESLLSGESCAVQKEAMTKGNEDDVSRVYMGTLVKNGKGRAIVDKVGMNTAMGKIANMIQNVEEDYTPLQKRLEGLGKFIVLVCVVICFIVALTGVLRGEPVMDMLISGITLAVAAVPEGLPAVVTIALAIGVSRMVSKNALVKKLPSVETLGCATVICSDKTGTITKNIMDVRRIYVNNESMNVEDIRDGDVRKIEILLKIGVMCNNAQVSGNKVIGDATEVALVKAYQRFLGDYTIDEESRDGEIPFSSERKCMSVKYGDVVYTKGAPEVVLDKSRRILINGVEEELTIHKKALIMGANKKMADDALRVIAVAYRRWSKEGLCDNGLTFVGLVGIMDPPRDEVCSAVEECKRAGIKTIMITGDNKETALAIASAVNILEDGDVAITGKELDEMTEEELKDKIDRVRVFARVTPKHKLMIVRALKERGEIVAMTGDGVNDAPAIKEADIGISMGITGTDVAKEAAAMILMDDNFSTIVHAVEEGRVIYSNIRKFIRYMLACNIGEVLSMFLAILAGLPFPLVPIQILWVNLVTDGLPAIALGLEPMERGIMNEPPKKDSGNIFSEGLLRLIFERGFIIGVTTLAVFYIIMKVGNNLNSARTGAFMTLVMTQLIHVLECKSERKSLLQINLLSNKFLLLSTGISLVMMLIVVYIPNLQAIFKTVSMNVGDWCIVLGFSFLGPIVSGISGIFNKRREV